MKITLRNHTRHEVLLTVRGIAKLLGDADERMEIDWDDVSEIWLTLTGDCDSLPIPR